MRRILLALLFSCVTSFGAAFTNPFPAVIRSPFTTNYPVADAVASNLVMQGSNVIVGILVGNGAGLTNVVVVSTNVVGMTNVTVVTTDAYILVTPTIQNTNTIFSLALDTNNVITRLVTWNIITNAIGTNPINLVLNKASFISATTIAGPDTIDVSIPEQITNAAANIAFTKITGFTVGRSDTTILKINPNGSDRTLTLPASWWMPLGTRSFTVTNGTRGKLTVNYDGTETNAVYVPFL